MATEQCLGGAIDSNLVSSPMPAIGLYIVAATLVCLLLLMCDVFRGYRNGIGNVPCRFFSLNSLTLTLLGIATKLPVDLNSLMPSPIDQLCKLSGSVLITVCMGFFISSIWNMSGVELFGNVASLTIVVVTIFINICIQLRTGIIFSFFFVEHVIALILMLLMLCAVWYVSLVNGWIMGGINFNWSFVKTDIAKRPFMQSVKNLFQTTRILCPQISMCLFTSYVTYVSLLGILSFLLVVEAFVRTFFFGHKGFCRGMSDYKWSTWVVFVTQFLTLGIGSFAILMRALYFVINYNPSDRQKMVDETSETGFKGQYTPLLLMADAETFFTRQDFKVLIRTVSFLGIYSLQGIFSICCVQVIIQGLEEVLIYLLFVTYTLLISTDYMVKALFWYTRNAYPNTFTKSSLAGSLELLSLKYTESLSQKCSNHRPYCLIQLLSNTEPSQEPLNVEGKCLLSVFLVQIAGILSPSNFSKLLVSAFDEVFELVFFVEENMESSIFFYSELYLKLAKDLWMSRNLSKHWFQKKIINPLKKKYPDEISGGFSSQSQSDRSKSILEDFISTAKKYPVLDTGNHFSLLEDLMRRTPDDIDACMKQLFVDIMHFLLPQLPKLVVEYTSHSQSTGVELEERAELVFKLVSKFAMLRNRVDWLSAETDDVQWIQPGDDLAHIEDQRIQPDDNLADIEDQRIQPILPA